MRDSKCNRESDGFSGRAGFTLVEMLVVIGIIAVLASIIIPGMQSAKLRATQAKCASNLRQLIAACNSYALENDNRWPNHSEWNQGEFFTFVTGRSNNVNGGATRDAPWMADDIIENNAHIFDTIFECPGARYGSAQAADPTQGFCYSYGMNKRPHLGRGTKITAIEVPSGYMGLIDYAGDGNDLKNPYGTKIQDASLRHDGVVNIAFMDGHVESHDPFDRTYLPLVGDDVEYWRYSLAGHRFWFGNNEGTVTEPPN